MHARSSWAAALGTLAVTLIATACAGSAGAAPTSGQVEPASAGVAILANSAKGLVVGTVPAALEQGGLTRWRLEASGAKAAANGAID